jgi:hypothetical protein
LSRSFRVDQDYADPNSVATELAAEFEVIGFAAPLVVVRRRSDGKKGSLFFQHSPRFYYAWQEGK